MRIRSFGLVSLLAGCFLVAACGAKSDLDSPDGSGGAPGGNGGGASVSGTGASGPQTATGTSSGTGGLEVVCDALEIEGPALSPAPWAPGTLQFSPALVRTELDGSGVAFVYTQGANVPGAMLNVASVVFDAWGPWPSSLGQGTAVITASQYAVGGGQDGWFSVLAPDSFSPTMTVWTQAPAAMEATGQQWDDVPPSMPRFVTSDAQYAVAGLARPAGPGLSYMSVVYVPWGFLPTPDTVVACATDAALAGAATVLDGGLLWAVSNGRPFGKCLTDDLTDGPPTRIQIVKAKEDPLDANVTFEQDDPSTYIFQIQLAPSSGGAWAAWERIQFEPPLQRRIQLVQLDNAGLPVTGKIIELSTGVIGYPIALTSLGSRPVLATVTPTDSGLLGLGVYVLSDNGELQTQTILVPDPGFEMGSGAALFGEPNGKRLLVAWDEISAVNNDERRVRVERLLCLPP